MNIVKKLNNFFNPDYGKIKMRSDEKLKVYPKINKSLKILDWKPKISINKGLEITNKYYLKIEFIKRCSIYQFVSQHIIDLII